MGKPQKIARLNKRFKVGYVITTYNQRIDRRLGLPMTVVKGGKSVAILEGPRGKRTMLVVTHTGKDAVLVDGKTEYGWVSNR